MQCLFEARQGWMVAALAVLLLAVLPAPSMSEEITPADEIQADPIGNTFGLVLGLDNFAVDLAQRLRYDYGAQFQYPFQNLKRHPKRSLFSMAGVATLILTDHHTHRALADPLRMERAGIVAPAAELSRWGEGTSALPLVLGLGVVGVLVDSPRERETSVMLLEALVTSATWTNLIKSTAGRERPREREESISEWEGPALFRGDDAGRGLRSFPSGHSTGIWAVATIMANRYPSYKIGPILGYGTATAMSYSRMVLGAHWLSDVVVGGLIGYGCAKQVLAAHETLQMPEKSSFGVGLDITGDYKGLSIRYDFR